MKSKTLLLVTCYLLLITLLGCEAFVKKFTRKPKDDQGKREELVLAPEEYKPTATKEEQYRQYFMFWKAWQEELITSLMPDMSINVNHKKQIDSAQEALKNLVNLKLLLNPEKQKELEPYIIRMVELGDAVAKDEYSVNKNWNRLEAERLKRDILQYFSFEHIKKDLV